MNIQRRLSYVKRGNQIDYMIKFAIPEMTASEFNIESEMLGCETWEDRRPVNFPNPLLLTEK